MNAASPSRPRHRTDSIEGLLERCSGRLEAEFQRRGIPPEDTEQILYEVLLALVLRREPVADPESWLLAVVEDRCRRHGGRTPEPAPDR